MSFMPRFTEYWDWTSERIQTEIAALENITSERLRKMSHREKQQRTIRLRTLNQELTSRVEWEQKLQAKAAVNGAAPAGGSRPKILVGH